jgi:hypothetical protein
MAPVGLKLFDIGQVFGYKAARHTALSALAIDADAIAMERQKPSFGVAAILGIENIDIRIEHFLSPRMPKSHQQRLQPQHNDQGCTSRKGGIAPAGKSKPIASLQDSGARRLLARRD